MNKDQINELLTGVAAVALAYALYKHLKPGSSGAVVPSPAAIKAAAADAAQAAQAGPAFAYGAPSPFTSMTDLLTGTVNDMGSWQGVDYLATIEEAPKVYGNGPRVVGGYW